MKREIATADGHGAIIMTDNHVMIESAASPLKRALKAPFTRRAWAELAYTLCSFPLAIVAVAFIVPMLENGPFWALSAPVVRKFADRSRFLAWRLLGERVPPPPPLRPIPLVRVRTPDTTRLSTAVQAAGGRVREWMFNNGAGINVTRLPASRIAELAAAEHITIRDIRVSARPWAWLRGAGLDKAAWWARVYFALKLPLAVVGFVVAVGCWLGGLFYLTFPAWGTLSPHGAFWWKLVPHGGFEGFPIMDLAGSLMFLPLGAALLLTCPWLLHGITNADRWLIRGLLGPSSPAERIRVLEESRAHAVDDSAARLRNIERDLHDGTQAQLVALAMKLGLAKEKLADAAPVDLARVTQLVGDAHRSALEAIVDLRTLARGIHPPVLDNGLADALATLAARSAMPVELVTDIPERPSGAIETIAYFSAAELLTNVAKHSGARHATLEAVHVPGLLRVRVTDDGRGDARPVPNGGLRGLADRVRTVDGRVEIDSPRGGPTTVTVELPSHA
jgi:signal transduction histidine kinase